MGPAFSCAEPGAGSFLSPFPAKLSLSSCGLLAQPPRGKRSTVPTTVSGMVRKHFPRREALHNKTPRGKHEWSPQKNRLPAHALLPLPSGYPFGAAFLKYFCICVKPHSKGTNSDTKGFCTTNPGLLGLIQGRPMTSQKKPKFTSIRY